MNNRGKDLSHLELLKNRLIYLSTLLHEDDETKERLRKDINESWKTIYEYLGKNKENPLDDDVFLFNHWVMYFTYDRSQSDVYAEFLLKKKFTSKNVLCGNISIEDIDDDNEEAWITYKKLSQIELTYCPGDNEFEEYNNLDDEEGEEYD